MTRLPDHRRVIHGRTYSQPWEPTGFDPIRRYRSGQHWAGRLLAVAIGVCLALALVRWIDWSLA